jgi:pimeloyl-ACP methyl ester carboxylesterase
MAWMDTARDGVRLALRDFGGSGQPVIPEAGHDVHLEQPEAWRAVWEQFLAQRLRI